MPKNIQDAAADPAGSVVELEAVSLGEFHELPHTTAVGRNRMQPDGQVVQCGAIAAVGEEGTGLRIGREAPVKDVSVYWLTGTAGSAARLYYEDARTWGQAQPRSSVPTGVAVFPNDITIRPLAERDHNVVHWTEFSRGGHFAALEAPDLLVGDVRVFP
ncbi:hypothetical protein ABZ807_26365 [Micromonospora sp. NPDC047548]|uniref:hypothetical protein n=1 Tax=Micromonospora sp. NPDC047548 TaxID=3155624 RepID=UPI0034074D68